MKVTQEKLPDSQIGLEIEIPAEISQKTYEKVVKNLARSANIPGFRKGKVPRQILVQRLGQQRIKAAALEEMIQDSLKEAIEQESIESLGNYKLRTSFEELITQFKPGEPLTFSAAVDVPPEVEPGDYQSLKITAEETSYDPTQVDDFLQERRVEQATLVPVEDRAAQMEDVAVVDYQGQFATEAGEAGEEIPDIQATDFQVELSEGKFVEGLVEGIVGMNLSQTKSIAVTFPEDYPREDLAGKPVIFTVTLKELKEKELPELDDDFAQEASEFETMQELRSSVEQQFQEKAQKETKSSIHEAIVQELLKQGSVALPETMIEKEVDNMLTQTAVQMQNYGMDIKQLFTAQTIPQMRERSRPEAIERIKQSLILQKIAEQQAIEPEPEAIEKRIAEITKQLGEREFDPERLKEVVTDELLTEKTLDWLQEKATVELVPKGTLADSEEAEVDEAIEVDETVTES